MASAFFFICMFMITVGGLLLFRPVQVNTITDYTRPAALEERKNITVKMARFLESNPQIVKQERLTTLPVNRDSGEIKKPEEPIYAPPATGAPTPVPYQVQISFQGSNIQFGSLAEYDQWIYKNAMQEPIGFLKQLQENDNPELYMDTLKKVSEMNSSDPVLEQVKMSYLQEARSLVGKTDGFHQQMMQKALQSYLDLEKDKDLGKRNADELLKSQ